MTVHPLSAIECNRKHSVQEKQDVFNEIASRTIYNSLKTFREQLTYLYLESKKISKEKNNSNLKLGYNDLSFFFDKEKTSIAYHIKMGKKE